MMNQIKIEKEFNGEKLILETGRLAKQAAGAVLATWGGTQVLATATMGNTKIDRDFFPLSVDYIEKFYANGKIPGSYTRREAKPSNEEIHISRLIDRSLRPLFDENIRNEIQIIITVLSLDEKNSSDILALLAASTALIISDIPFSNPVAAVRVGYIGDQLIINPYYEQLEELSLDLIVAGTGKAIIMIEGGGNEIPEEKVLHAVKEAHQIIKSLIEFKIKLLKKITIIKRKVEPFTLSENLQKQIVDQHESDLKKILNIKGKIKRENEKKIFYDQINDSFSESDLPIEQIPKILYQLESKIVRDMILNENHRPDGRNLEELRNVDCEVNPLICPHGSALFTRGETQALGVATIGSDRDRQKIDLTRKTFNKNFLLHYNFPPYSVGEVGRLVSIGRREIGHGMLAERSLATILPPHDEFDFTVRLVVEILESNGSSSMATVCSGSMAFMAAGIPIKKHVAGIAMGLILEKENFKILTDIQGIEDSLGDMDFKVAGTKEGITGFQLDIKVEGITIEIMEKALQQAKEARHQILDKMYQCISIPQASKEGVPQRKVVTIARDKIKNLIGPGGKNIKQIVEDTRSDVSVSDNGEVKIFSPNKKILEETEVLVKKYSGSVDVGEEFLGQVKKVTNFGAFIELVPGVEGLCHISKLSKEPIKNIFDYIKKGDSLKVKVQKVDERGKINLVSV